MEGVETPVRRRETRFKVPPTPCMTRIGYGTGVSVYHLERSPKAGLAMSPWAVKKAMKAPKAGAYGDRIKKEADILKDLEHPNIVGFRGFTKSEDGREVLAMEECTQSLGDLLEKYREEGRTEPLSVNIILKVVRCVTSALNYLHTERNLLHGDIKSFNVLIKGDFDSIKICDFGVSLKLDDKGEIPDMNDYVGTECWSAPETFDEGPITTKSDIFSLGITIWEMLTIKLPVDDCLDQSNVINSTIESTGEEEVSFDEIVEVSNIQFGDRPQLPEKGFAPEYDPIIHLYKWCTDEDFTKRPTATEILNYIEKLKDTS